MKNVISKTSDTLPIHLYFEHINDFSPEAIVCNVPELNRLFLLRKNIKNLKANILNNPALRNSLETIYQDKERISSLKAELKHYNAYQEENI